MANEIEISTQQLAVIQEADAAQIVVIKNSDQFNRANEILLRIKSVKEMISTELRPDIKKAHDLHASLLSKEKKYLDPLLQREKVLNAAVKRYLVEEDNRRREADRLIREEAARKEREAQEAILAAAVRTEAEGDYKGAADLLEQAEDYHVPVLATVPQTKTVKSFNESGNSKFNADIDVELKDTAALVDAIVAGRVPLACVKIELRMKETKEFFKKRDITEYNADGLIVTPTYSIKRQTY